MRHGFLLIDKPEGFSSHDAVAVTRKRLSERKIGHLGTLDPAASGLLVLAVGAKALKVVELFERCDKTYAADITFGAVSTTYDREGVLEELAPKPGWVVPDLVTLQNVLEDHIHGAIQQTPPLHSALKIGGERAYRKARRGEDVQMKQREVTIHECNILSYDYPQLSLSLTCSSGTYIRSIAHDLGQLLRCGGYLSGLRRTQVGEWSVEDACAPDDATFTRIIPLKEILVGRHAIDLSAEDAEDVRHGRDIAHEVQSDTIGWFDGLPIAVLVPAKDGSRRAHARKVL